MTSIPGSALGDSVAFKGVFDCSQDRLWRAITDPEALSAWLGGRVSIEAGVGGRIGFDLPGDGVRAHGLVRLFDPPRPDFQVALLEHTFIEAQEPSLTSVCRWVVRAIEGGSELLFTQDGLGEADRDRLSAVWRSRLGGSIGLAGSPMETRTSRAEACAHLRAARRVLLISFIGPEVPATLCAAGFEVFAKVGPEPHAWASCRHRSGEEPGFDPCPDPPAAIDLLHLDVGDAFAEYLDVAVRLGAKTFWYHSARTCPPQPHDNRGCWLPASQSQAQRRAVEATGLEYIDEHYIADIARSL